MYYFVFQILFFAFLLFYFYKWKNNIILSYISFIWLISSVFSVFFYFVLEPSNVTIEGLIFFDLCFFISLYSVRGLNNINIKISSRQVDAINKFMLLLGIISIIPCVENLLQIVTSYFNDSTSDDLLDLYNDKMDSDTDMRKLTNWLSLPGRICNSITCRLQQLSYFIFFILLCYKPMKKKSLLICILPILNPLFFGVAKSGRGAVVFAFIYLIFLYLVFRDRISDNVKKKLKRNFILIGSGFAVLLFILTMARLSSAYTNNNAFISLSLYLGEGQVRFLDEMWHIKQHTMGDNSFSFFKNLFGLETFSDNLARREYWSITKTGVDPRFFYTYIGDIFSDLGYYTLALFVILNLMITKILRHRVSLCNLFLICVFCYVIVNGFSIYALKIYDLTLNIFTCLIALFIITNLELKKINNKA